jgi:hypothetical protein
MSETWRWAIDAGIAIVTFAAGLAARPWVERKIRKDTITEERTRAVSDLTTDIGNFLTVAGGFEFDLGALPRAKNVWSDVGPRLEHMYQFPPLPDLQKPLEAMWKLGLLLIATMQVLVDLPADDPQRERFEELRIQRSETLERERSTVIRRLGGSPLSSGITLSDATEG